MHPISQLDIIVPEEQISLKAEHGEYLWGEIWIQCGGCAFPCERWTDFLVQVVGSWMEAAIDLPQEAQAEFSFVDGPYHLLGKLIGGDVLEDQFVETTLMSHRSCDGTGAMGERRRAKFCVQRQQFTRALLESAERIVNAAQRHDWQCDEVVALNRTWHLLRDSDW